MDTYVTQHGTTLTPAGGQVMAMALDKTNNRDKTVSTRSRIFSSDFLEHKVIEFIVSTFCIPLL